jgi:hypothetical protein
LIKDNWVFDVDNGIEFKTEGYFGDYKIIFRLPKGVSYGEMDFKFSCSGL